MNIQEAFPSKYLKASDLNGRNVVVQIAGARIEGIGQNKDQKLVLSFYGKEKTFVCNKTNASTIAKLHGPDTEAWVGKSITLTAREVEFQGEMVLALRVSLQAPPASAVKAPPPPPVEEPVTDGLDEDVPFSSAPFLCGALT